MKIVAWTNYREISYVITSQLTSIKCLNRLQIVKHVLKYHLR